MVPSNIDLYLQGKFPFTMLWARDNTSNLSCLVSRKIRNLTETCLVQTWLESTPMLRHIFKASLTRTHPTTARLYLGPEEDNPIHFALIIISLDSKKYVREDFWRRQADKKRVKSQEQHQVKFVWRRGV